MFQRPFTREARSQMVERCERLFPSMKHPNLDCRLYQFLNDLIYAKEDKKREALLILYK